MSTPKSLLPGGIISLSIIGMVWGDVIHGTARSPAPEEPAIPNANSPKSSLTVAPPWWSADVSLSSEHDAHGVPHVSRDAEHPPGYDVQCDHGNENDPTSSIYNLGVSGARAPLPGAKDNQWFTLRILAQGDRLRTWVNGEPGADCHLPPGGYAKGYILLQQHHPTGVVEFRQVRIRPL